MNIYIAAPMGGRTYEEVTNYFEKARTDLNRFYRVYSPMSCKFGDSELEGTLGTSGYQGVLTNDQAIFKRGHWMVEQSDVLFMDLTMAKRVSIGCMFELAWASHLGKHIVIVMDADDSLHDHAFVKQSAHVVIRTYSKAIRYLIELSGDIG